MTGQNRMRFVSFHTHSTYSYGDGFGTVKDHVERVVSLGMGALALSEHGNVNSHAALERECRLAGIKPIFGVEAYFAPPKTKSKFHIGLFAMDDEGYRNLNRIVSQSYIDSYQWPTVHWESLVKHNRGIAVLSGCADSLISCTLLGGKSLGERRDEIDDRSYSVARRRIERFRDVFANRFFLEVQRFSKLDRTCTLNPTLAELSSDTGVPLIATADVHYPYPTQNKMQSMLHASRRSSSVAITEAEWEYNILLTYPESDKEIHDDLIGTGLSERDAMRAIEQTATLSQSCTVELPKAKPLRFRVPASKTILCGGKPTAKDLDQVHSFGSTLYLRQKIKEGWEYRCNQRPELKRYSKEYSKRISHELKIIADKDFSDYFLAVADLVSRAKDRSTVVGPARGSAAASLVCYLLRITEIDPLHPIFEHMVFERFIDPTRSDMPDIDLDFDDERRMEVAEDARSIYGQENVANVGNHIKYRGKLALQGVARAHGLSPKVFEPIGKRCAVRVETDDRVDDSILDIIESYASNPEIASLVDQYRTQLDQAIALEGNQHSLGIHAGGFVIASEPIPDVCAIYTKFKGTGRNREVAQVIPYEKRDAEYLNFLKMDFLGLTAMGMIARCLEWSDISLDDLYALFYRAPEYEQERILELFQIDDVTGIFQYEGGTTRALCRRVKPKDFHELAAVGALSRPGPYYGGQADAYVDVKYGLVEQVSIHPNFDKHVEWTFGQIVYQEQIMWILRDVAGFDIKEVLRVRKIIGKKLGEHQFEEIWERFKTGCEKTSGLDDDISFRIFSSIRTAAGYAFNIAHAYSYALVAWWQAWFKIHFPAIFFAASLAKNGDGKDDLPRRVALCQDSIRHRIGIESLDPFASQANWYPLDRSIRPGFRQIPKIGEATADDMARYQDEIVVREWEDFGAVAGIGPKTIETLKTFATKTDPLGLTRTEDQLNEFRRQLASGDFESFGLPGDDEFCLSNGIPEDNDHCAFVGLVANVVYRDEIESIRTRTGQSVDEIKAGLDNPEATKKATIFAYDEHGEVALRISRWRYAALASKLSSLKADYHIVVVWGRTFEGKGNSIQVKSLWILDPDE